MTISDGYILETIYLIGILELQKQIKLLESIKKLFYSYMIPSMMTILGDSNGRARQGHTKCFKMVPVAPSLSI